jgi:hypothetical protein
MQFESFDNFLCLLYKAAFFGSLLCPFSLLFFYRRSKMQLQPSILNSIPFSMLQCWQAYSLSGPPCVGKCMPRHVYTALMRCHHITVAYWFRLCHIKTQTKCKGITVCDSTIHFFQFSLTSGILK